jgi:hypothetical protein
MSLTLTGYPLVAGVVPLSTLNSWFSLIQNKFGAIDDNDIATGASINIDKLQYQYQEMLVSLTIKRQDLAAGWPAGSASTPLVAVPIPGTNGDPDWTATDVFWVCTDTGDGLGQFDVRYGYFNNAVWSNTASVITGTVMGNPAAGANQPNGGSALEGGSVAITLTANPSYLALMSANVSATTLAGGAQYDFLTVSVILRRKIKGAT